MSKCGFGTDAEKHGNSEKCDAHGYTLDNMELGSSSKSDRNVPIYSNGQRTDVYEFDKRSENKDQLLQAKSEKLSSTLQR